MTKSEIKKKLKSLGYKHHSSNYRNKTEHFRKEFKELPDCFIEITFKNNVLWRHEVIPMSINRVEVIEEIIIAYNIMDTDLEELGHEKVVTKNII